MVNKKNNKKNKNKYKNNELQEMIKKNNFNFNQLLEYFKNLYKINDYKDINFKINKEINKEIIEEIELYIKMYINNDIFKDNIDKYFKNDIKNKITCDNLKYLLFIYLGNYKLDKLNQFLYNLVLNNICDYNKIFIEYVNLIIELNDDYFNNVKNFYGETSEQYINDDKYFYENRINDYTNNYKDDNLKKIIYIKNKNKNYYKANSNKFIDKFWENIKHDNNILSCLIKNYLNNLNMKTNCFRFF